MRTGLPALGRPESGAAGRPEVKGLRPSGLVMPGWRLLARTGARVLDRGAGGLGANRASENRWVRRTRVRRGACTCGLGLWPGPAWGRRGFRAGLKSKNNCFKDVPFEGLEVWVFFAF